MTRLPAAPPRSPAVAAMFARYGRRYRVWVVLAAMFGTVSAVMEATIVNVALPEIIAVFQLTHDHVQLLSSGFLAATTVSMLLSNWFSQRLGLRRAYIVAVSALLACSLAAALAPNFAALAVFRVAQGFVAGLIQPMAMVIIASVFPPQARGRAMSAYGLGIILSPAIGPAVGGVLIEQFGWRAVFLVTLPFCLAGAALARRFIVDPAPPTRRAPPDLIGAGILTAALVAVMGGLSSLHGAPAVAAVALAAGLVFAAIFVAWERRTPDPLIDLGIFRNAGFPAVAIVSLTYGIGIYGSTYLGPLLAQDGFGFSASQAGAMLMPGGVALAIALLAAGPLADRIPAHRVAMAGLGCFAVSAVLLGVVPGAPGFWLLAGLVAIGRAGLGMIIPGLNTSALRLLPFGHESAGAAATSFFRQLGGTLGVALIALFLEARRAPGDTLTSLHSLQEGFLLIALAYGLALVSASRMHAGRPSSPPRP